MAEVLGRFFGHLFGGRTRVVAPSEALHTVDPGIVAVLKKYESDLVRLTGLPEMHWTIHNEGGTAKEGDYSLELDNVAYFRLVRMPGCCGVCISTGATVFSSQRGKGVGTLLNRLRVDLAEHFGYGLLLCTDIEQNTAQRRVLAKGGWTDIASFNNPKTGNTVLLTAIGIGGNKPVPMQDTENFLTGGKTLRELSEGK